MKFLQILSLVVLSALTIFATQDANAGKWDKAYQTLTEEFNAAAKAPKKVDPPPELKYESKPKFPTDTEKLTVKDANVIRTTLPKQLTPSKPASSGPQP